MDENVRFGLSGRTRFWLYQLLSLLAFVAVVFGGEYRTSAIVLFVALLIWLCFFDGVNRRGERTRLGFSRKQAERFGIASLFGHKLDD